MRDDAQTGDTGRPAMPCLIEAAKSHLEQAFAILKKGMVAGMSLETNLASIEHRRQVEAMMPFLDPAERKTIKRLERKLDRQLHAAASVITTLEGAMLELKRSRHATLLDDDDRMAIERLKSICVKIQESYLR